MRNRPDLPEEVEARRLDLMWPAGGILMCHHMTDITCHPCPRCAQEAWTDHREKHSE